MLSSNYYYLPLIDLEVGPESNRRFSLTRTTLHYFYSVVKRLGGRSRTCVANSDSKSDGPYRQSNSEIVRLHSQIHAGKVSSPKPSPPGCQLSFSWNAAPLGLEPRKILVQSEAGLPIPLRSNKKMGCLHLEPRLRMQPRYHS